MVCRSPGSCVLAVSHKAGVQWTSLSVSRNNSKQPAWVELGKAVTDIFSAKSPPPQEKKTKQNKKSTCSSSGCPVLSLNSICPVKTPQSRTCRGEVFSSHFLQSYCLNQSPYQYLWRWLDSLFWSSMVCFSDLRWKDALWASVPSRRRLKRSECCVWSEASHRQLGRVPCISRAAA